MEINAITINDIGSNEIVDTITISSRLGGGALKALNSSP